MPGLDVGLPARILYLLKHLHLHTKLHRVRLQLSWLQGWAKLVLIALERYSVALKRLTFNLR